MPEKKNKVLEKVVVKSPLMVEAASLSTAAKVLELPSEDERQPDLLYSTAILVSTGTNKNGATFLGSEIVRAKDSIVHKALDIEHDEQMVVGHITNAAYMYQDGSPFDPEEAMASSTEELDSRDMDIAVSLVLHKARFPEVASEVKNGEWMVSMETFYSDYDIKIGDIMVPRAQAEALGYDNLVGQVVQLKDGTKELGFHIVSKVLRGITFAGIGLVKRPANERSVILETASLSEYIEDRKETASVLDLSAVASVEFPAKEESSDNKANSVELIELVRQVVKEEIGLTLDQVEKEFFTKSDVVNSRPGTCVHFKKYLVDIPGPEQDNLPEPGTDTSQYPLYNNPGSDAYPPGTKILAENYCSLFDRPCSARPGDATLPTCWRNVFARTVRDEITSHEEVLEETRVNKGLQDLQKKIDESRKFIK